MNTKEDVLKQAVETYSTALSARLIARSRLHEAEDEDAKTRKALATAKDSLKNLEKELTEGVFTPGLVPSIVKYFDKSHEHSVTTLE